MTPGKVGAVPRPGGERERREIDARLFLAVHAANPVAVGRALKAGADVNAVDPDTGLSALHIAVGTNNLDLCRHLIEERHAAFFPDRFGRWPSLVAVECHVSDELAVYIAEKEAEYLRRNPGVTNI